MSPPLWSLGVLAGGASTRMGSDKASRPFRDTTLLDHAIARFAPAGMPVLVSTRAAGGLARAGTVPVFDAEPGLGPLAGIAALLARAPAPFLLIAPIDLPLLPPACGEAMAGALHPDSQAVVLSWKGRVEPFPALVSRDLAPLLAGLLHRGLRRADAFHGPASARVVPFVDLFPGWDPEAAFLNVNTPEDLRRAELLIASEGR